LAAGSLLIPATSIAIGEPNGDEGYLGISVGRAELVFSLPVASLAQLRQSLLMAGDDADRKVIIGRVPHQSGRSDQTRLICF
jgi:hypothetical protein